MHLTQDAAAVNLDSWGIKRLFSHCFVVGLLGRVVQEMLVATSSSTHVMWFFCSSYLVLPG